MVRLLLLIAALLSTTTANATPLLDSTRLAIEVGWRYTPNVTFARQARENGYPITTPDRGGPAVLATFAYQFKETLEIAIEVGYSAENYRLIGAPELLLQQIPVLVDGRWWFASVGDFSFYAGFGGGYLLNYWTGGPIGFTEADTTTPVFILGMTVALSKTISLIIEDRETLARSVAETVGYAQVGGNMLTIGLHYSFPPLVHKGGEEFKW
jgi:hypothetical protein